MDKVDLKSREVSWKTIKMRGGGCLKSFNCGDSG